MPQIVQGYNRFMGGVDLSEMLIGLQIQRWHSRIFARLLNKSAINAWLVYRAHSNGEYMSLYNFKYISTATTAWTTCYRRAYRFGLHVYRRAISREQQQNGAALLGIL